VQPPGCCPRRCHRGRHGNDRKQVCDSNRQREIGGKRSATELGRACRAGSDCDVFRSRGSDQQRPDFLLRRLELVGDSGQHLAAMAGTLLLRHVPSSNARRAVVKSCATRMSSLCRISASRRSLPWLCWESVGLFPTALDPDPSTLHAVRSPPPRSFAFRFRVFFAPPLASGLSLDWRRIFTHRPPKKRADRNYIPSAHVAVRLAPRITAPRRANNSSRHHNPFLLFTLRTQSDAAT